MLAQERLSCDRPDFRLCGASRASPTPLTRTSKQMALCDEICRHVSKHVIGNARIQIKVRKGRSEKVTRYRSKVGQPVGRTGSKCAGSFFPTTPPTTHSGRSLVPVFPETLPTGPRGKSHSDVGMGPLVCYLSQGTDAIFFITISFTTILTTVLSGKSGLTNSST